MCAGGPRGILDISPQFPNTHVKILQISTFVKVLQSFSRKPERFLFGPGRAETSRRDPAGDARGPGSWLGRRSGAVASSLLVRLNFHQFLGRCCFLHK